MIFAFAHPHKPGDLCSKRTCAYAAQSPALAGTQVFDDLPLLIIRESTAQEYLTQPIPDDWYIPPLYDGDPCKYFYEVSSD